MMIGRNNRIDNAAAKRSGRVAEEVIVDPADWIAGLRKDSRPEARNAGRKGDDVKMEAKTTGRRIIKTAILIMLLAGLGGCHRGGDVETIPPASEAALGRTYLMKQKFWSVGDQFTIKDSSGEAIFQVKGRIFSVGDGYAPRFLDQFEC